MTASTFFRRARALAFRVIDNFHGVFLKTDGEQMARDGPRDLPEKTT
jgi:hypothetical protein